MSESTDSEMCTIYLSRSQAKMLVDEPRCRRIKYRRLQGLMYVHSQDLDSTWLIFLTRTPLASLHTEHPYTRSEGKEHYYCLNTFQDLESYSLSIYPSKRVSCTLVHLFSWSPSIMRYLVHTPSHIRILDVLIKKIAEGHHHQVRLKLGAWLMNPRLRKANGG